MVYFDTTHPSGSISPSSDFDEFRAEVANDGLETVKFEAARAVRKIKGQGVDNGDVAALSAEEGQIDGRARRIEREGRP